MSQYYRLLQDDEMGFQRVFQSSTPMTFNFYPRGTIRLTEELQRYWHKLNDNDLDAWTGGELGGYPDAAFCNGLHKVRLNRDYINGKRLDGDYPVMERLVCGRNVVCGEEVVANGIYGIPNGTMVLKLETINPNNLVPMTHESHPHLIHIANIITNNVAPNGLKQVNAFPHRGGREGKPVYYPLWSNETVYYPLNMLEKVEFPVPVYNPPEENMTYTLKQPAIYDWYEGEFPIKFDQMNPKPLAHIFRASIQVTGTRIRRQDYKVEEGVAACKTLGLKYGLYHFLSPNGIAEQAALFLSVWNKVGGADLAPMVDVEIDLQKSYSGTVGNQTWQNHIKTFIDLIAAGTGKTPIIYTNRNFWSFAMTKNWAGQLTPPAWTSDYPLWLAWYPTSPETFSAPPASVMPAGWTKWAMWQWEDGGRQNGYQANDLNIPSDWYAAELGGVVAPPPPPPDPNPTVFPNEVGLTIGAEQKWYVPK